ncbi:hypothetical protein TEA_020151 [Camellia sinensis var. sinensis]|uniref:Uncharacterized protein n=1 Tax=Camellia sinensis var. sinensis TaxID=542762 RepID=A0A4S4DH69_CAMSN|nr:hypothetical protein TEA_020151 [Camellia sinensis var. sinensis]
MQLHRFAATNNSSPLRSPPQFRPSTILYSCSVASNYAAGSFNHHGMQYSTTMSNDPDIHEEFRPTNKLESSGLSLKDIVEQLTLLFTDLTALGYYGLLTIDMPFADVHLSAKNILEDPELKNAVKAYRHHIISNSNKELSSGNLYWLVSSFKISYWG